MSASRGLTTAVWESSATMAEGSGDPTLTGHGGKCSATMVAEILPTSAPLVVLAVVSAMSAGESSQGLALNFFFLPRTDFASQLISMDSDGTMYPSMQMLLWSP